MSGGSERGCLRAAILTGQKLFKTVFSGKSAIKREKIPVVDTRGHPSDPAFVLLANGARKGLILDTLFPGRPFSTEMPVLTTEKSDPLPKPSYLLPGPG